MSQGWFETDDEYRDRAEQEANEAVIEESTGSAPSQGFFESDTDYRDRVSREAAERVITDSTGSAPSQGFFESDDDYRRRVISESHERIVRDSGRGAPSQGLFESDGAYRARLHEEANARIISDATGSTPSPGWLESATAYRQRIAVQADEYRARTSSKGRAAYPPDDSSGSTGASIERRSAPAGVWFLVVVSAVAAIALFGGRSTSLRVAQQTDPIVVTSSNVNVRNEPSTRARVLRRVNRGDRLQRISVQGDWTEVRYSPDAAGGTAWIHSSFVTSLAEWSVGTSTATSPMEKVSPLTVPEASAPEQSGTLVLIDPRGTSGQAEALASPRHDDASPSPTEDAGVDVERQASPLFASGNASLREDISVPVVPVERAEVGMAGSRVENTEESSLREAAAIDPAAAAQRWASSIRSGRPLQLAVKHDHRLMRIHRLLNGVLTITWQGVSFESAWRSDSFAVDWANVKDVKQNFINKRDHSVVALELEVNRIVNGKRDGRRYKFVTGHGWIGREQDVQCPDCTPLIPAVVRLVETLRSQATPAMLLAR